MVVVALTNRRKYMRTIVRFKHRQRLWVQSSRWSGNPIHIVSIFFGDDETWTLRIRYLIGRVKLVSQTEECTYREKLVGALVFDANIVVWRVQSCSLDRLGLFGTAILDSPWLC